MWCDFPDLPLPFFPWFKEIGSQLGKVLGQKPTPAVNSKRDPQLLIEIHTSENIKQEVALVDQNGNLMHTQKVVYRNLPNACFKCLKQGHLIKDCPLLDKGKKPVSPDDFQEVNKKPHNTKPKHNDRSKQQFNRFSPLLVEVDHPLTGPVVLLQEASQNQGQHSENNKEALSDDNMSDRYADCEGECPLSPTQHTSSKDDT